MEQAAAPSGTTVSQAAEQFAALLEPETDIPSEQVEQEEVSTAEADAADEVESVEVDEQQEAAPKAPETYRVKVDGEEVEVTLEELQKGYSRTADYTRKTMQTAEQRKALEAEQAAARQEREQYQQMLGALAVTLKQQEVAPPDEALRQSDPVEFSIRWADYQRRQEQQRLVQAEQQRLQQQAHLERQQAMQGHLAREQELLVSAIPEWSDAERARAEKQAIAKFAQANGYRDEELKNLFDHRAVVLMRKAMLYDQLTQTKPAPAKPATRVLPPGTGNAARPASEVTRSKQRLAQTGRIRDAAAVFEKML